MPLKYFMNEVTRFSNYSVYVPTFARLLHQCNSKYCVQGKKYVTGDKKIDAISDTFVKIYAFPYIAIAASVNRIKGYYTLLVACAIPATVVAHNFEILTNYYQPTIAVGIAGTTALFAVGSIFNHLVGALYFKEKGKLVKISYLNYWGRRIDVECPISDIALVCYESSYKYSHLLRYSTNQRLRLSIRFGLILDKPLFQDILAVET